MTIEKYSDAFLLTITFLEEIAAYEKRVPTNSDIMDLVNSISNEIDVHVNLSSERMGVDKEIEAKLFINRLVWGYNDLKIEIYYFYDWIKHGSYELNFYPDGTFNKCGGVVDAKMILMREFYEKNSQN